MTSTATYAARMLCVFVLVGFTWLVLEPAVLAYRERLRNRRRLEWELAKLGVHDPEHCRECRRDGRPS